jgi:hypothetical protein
VAHFLLQLMVDLDGARWSLRMASDVEEVHVRVEEAHLHKENGLGASGNLIL